MLNVILFCDNTEHPILPQLNLWAETLSQEYDIHVESDINALKGGDILFLLSCNSIIRQNIRDRFRHVLVLHASDLPKGRGWSPYIWEVLNGATQITVSLLTAEDAVDSGEIWKKMSFTVEAWDLLDDIHHKLFQCEYDLILYALTHVNIVEPAPQDDSVTPSYWPKRTPEDSEVDPNQSVAELFNQLRVCDSRRYPAFFYLHGKRFKLIVESYDE